MRALHRLRLTTTNALLAVSHQPVAAVRSPLGLLALAGLAALGSVRLLRRQPWRSTDSGTTRTITRDRSERWAA